MAKRAFRAGLGLGAALLAAAPAAAGDDPVAVRLGGAALRIPAAELASGPQAFWERALGALGLSASPVSVRIPAAEMAALAPGWRAAGRDGFEWSMAGLSPAAERAERRAQRAFAARVWFGRDEFAGAAVAPHASGLYAVRPRGWLDGHWLAVRTPPVPARPPPADLLAAQCWTAPGQPPRCNAMLLHRGLLVRFAARESELGLLDALRDAARGRIDAWRAAP